MSFHFGGHAVQHSCKSASRITGWTGRTKREDKRRVNRTYRRCFKRQIIDGLEAVSEFDPPRKAFLTHWDVS